MALKLKKQLSINDVLLDVSYQPVIDINVTLTRKFKTDSMITTVLYDSLDDYNTKKRSRLTEIDQLNNIRNIQIEEIPYDNAATDVLEKFVLFLNLTVKAKLLANNPTWSDEDVEVINLSIS